MAAVKGLVPCLLAHLLHACPDCVLNNVAVAVVAFLSPTFAGVLCCTAPHMAARVCVQVDPTLTRADRLVGQVLGEVGALPDVFIELEINFFLLRRLLGVRTAVGALMQQPYFPLGTCLQRCLWMDPVKTALGTCCGGHCGVQAGLTVHNPADSMSLQRYAVFTPCCAPPVLAIPNVVPQQLIAVHALCHSRNMSATRWRWVAACALLLAAA